MRPHEDTGYHGQSVAPVPARYCAGHRDVDHCRFGAAAWLRRAVLAHNVLTALKRLALPPDLLTVRPIRLWFLVFTAPGRIITHRGSSGRVSPRRAVVSAMARGPLLGACAVVSAVLQDHSRVRFRALTAQCPCGSGTGTEPLGDMPRHPRCWWPARVPSSAPRRREWALLQRSYVRIRVRLGACPSTAPFWTGQPARVVIPMPHG